MGLYERWTADSATGQKIAVHAFGASLRELARGAVTLQQIITAFSLDAEDQTQLNAIIAKHQGLSTDLAKSDFRTKLHDVMLLCESGHYTKSKAQTELGF